MTLRDIDGLKTLLSNGYAVCNEVSVSKFVIEICRLFTCSFTHPEYGTSQSAISHITSAIINTRATTYTKPSAQKRLALVKRRSTPFCSVTTKRVLQVTTPLSAHMPPSPSATMIYISSQPIPTSQKRIVTPLQANCASSHPHTKTPSSLA